MKKFIEEFKAFAMRGNVLDLAVGMIIGSAFSKITNSLVNDVIMPTISVLLGGMDFTSWKIILKQAIVENGQEVTAAISINYGTFISTVLDFVILAFAIFCMIKAINRLHKKQEQSLAEPAPAVPSAEEQLLTEIRDLLKNKND